MQITDTPTIKRYYQALIEKDSQYIGLFFVGVKTTGVFCIATCRARKPKANNVEFFSTYLDALRFGYRPCKICKPTENAEEAPISVQQAIAMVRDQPKTKISDWQLKEQGIQPEQVRRWFQKHYGITFQKFQRMYRLNQAFLELKSGKSVVDSALDSGYDSLSGFGYAVKSITGKSPQQQTNIILIDRFTTTLGPMYICATATGICLLEFTDRRMLETELEDLQKRFKATIITGENEHMMQGKKEILEYFAGKRQVFDVSLCMAGTDFQQIIWQELLKVPSGHTQSYETLAQQANRPTSTRAVASACGYNKIAIIVPCHRIVGKNNALTGYGGGLERKKWLIDHEKQMSNQY